MDPNCENTGSKQGLSIQGLNTGIKASIFPNPIQNNIVNISLPVVAPKNNILVIYDLQGVKVRQYVLDGYVSTINLDNLESGVYIFKINGEAYRDVCKVIIQ